MTDKSASAIREILKKYDEKPYSDISGCLSDLTSLISEHYYPKAFVEWLLVNAEIVEYKGVNMWKVYLAGFMSHPYFTTDELYKIRKENER